MGDNDAQLAAIREKAEGMGLQYDTDVKERCFALFNGPCRTLKEFLEKEDSDYLLIAKYNEKGIAAAKSFLAALDPDAVKVMVTGDCYTCGLSGIGTYGATMGRRDCMISADKSDNPKARSDYQKSLPGPDCPGPAPDNKEWVMVLREKADCDGGD